MKDGPFQHEMKGNSTDIYRAAFNADNRARFYAEALDDFIGLLQRAQRIVRLNPAGGPLHDEIREAFKKHSVKELPDPVLTASVEEPKS